ncbi:MAG: DegV family protein [Ruthenibacterium sp.]
MSIQIIADSSCDLTPALKNLMQIQLVGFELTIGEQMFKDDASLEVKTLLAAMKAYKGPASTACPSPEEFAAHMRAADACFVITISSKLSGCHNAAMVARDMVLEENPDKKIHVFDSESAAAGETRLAMFLHEAIVAGKDFDTIVTQATDFIAQMRTRFVLEDLDNLIKNGRVSKVAGMVGTVLNLRPIMGENGHGEIICFEKIRGTQNAMRRLVELIAEATVDTARASLTLVMTYCNCAERAAELKKDLLAKCTALREVIFVPTAGLSSVYANDGGIVVAF